MAKTRVFVSSTYYDLRHLRASLDVFIRSIGFDSVLSEKGNIAYNPSTALDESCYREVSNCDILVLIVGGRYGSQASADDAAATDKYHDRYDSITRKEMAEAIRRDIPVYILFDRGVYAEYQTYLRNKANTSVSYAHVDSINIFRMIEEITSLPRNNPYTTFDRFAEIESWLREQWSGLFRDMLSRKSENIQLIELQSQVRELFTINSMLRTYLEELIKQAKPQESEQIILAEELKASEAHDERMVRDNELGRYLLRGFSSLEPKTIAAAARDTTDIRSFVSELEKRMDHNDRGDFSSASDSLIDDESGRNDLARLKAALTP